VLDLIRLVRVVVDLALHVDPVALGFAPFGRATFRSSAARSTASARALDCPDAARRCRLSRAGDVLLVVSVQITQPGVTRSASPRDEHPERPAVQVVSGHPAFLPH
jgi:hypothetical protein